MELSCSPLSQEFYLETATLRLLCESVNSPRSLAVSMLIENGEWEQYLDLDIDPSKYRTVSNFADDYLVTSFLRKSPNIPLQVDKTRVAVDSFFKSEDDCRRTNRRFVSGGLINHHKHFLAVRREVASILGPLSTRDLQSCAEGFGFGPGANVGVRGRGMVLSDKFDNNITLTRNLYPFYKTILGDIWWEHQSHPMIVKGNRFTTVPKDAKKDRGICVEPLLNSYVQLGIGKVLRSKLRASGLDLSTQMRNQHLASRAQVEGLATIDLESASDTVSLEVVRELLPPRWFELLSLARSNFTTINGVDVELEKFSSMGNGYTFELESLLFWSIVRVVVPSSKHQLCSVFGDDIIVPQDFAQELIETLEYFGFRVNESKSFLAGNFFESCGTDWYEGTNVRPVYAKGSRDGIPYALQLANKLRMYSYMRNFGLGCDSTFKSAWDFLVRHIPHPWSSCHSCPTLGDVGIISDFSEVKHKRPKHKQYEGVRIKTVQIRPKFVSKRTIGRHLWALRSVGYGDPLILWNTPVAGVTFKDTGFTKGREPRRGFLSKPMTKWTYLLKWSEGLLWTDRCLNS